MWRYDVRDISEQHFRQLRMLIRLQRAKAHIVVVTERAWPSEISTSPRQHGGRVHGDAIN